MSLLLALNRFHTLFWCFSCWLWTSECKLGYILHNILEVLLLIFIKISLGLIFRGPFQTQSPRDVPKKIVMEIQRMCVIDSKLSIKTPERGNEVSDVHLVSLLLNLNRFHILFWCFHCWLILYYTIFILNIVCTIFYYLEWEAFQLYQ